MGDDEIDALRDLLAGSFGYQSWAAGVAMIAAVGRDHAESKLALVGRAVRAGFRGDERVASAVRNALLPGRTPKEAGVTLQIIQRKLRAAIDAKWHED